jgi:hypothetical protein
MSDLSSPPQTSSAPGGKNTMAFIGFLLALVAPIIFLIAGIVSLAHATGVANALFGVLGTVTVPLAIVAIILGHISFAQAKQAPRGFAVASLILGYATLATFVGFLFFILATFH